MRQKTDRQEKTRGRCAHDVSPAYRPSRHGFGPGGHVTGGNRPASPLPRLPLLTLIVNRGSALCGRPDSAGAAKRVPVTPPPLARLPVGKMRVPDGFTVLFSSNAVAFLTHHKGDDRVHYETQSPHRGPSSPCIRYESVTFLLLRISHRTGGDARTAVGLPIGSSDHG